MEALSGGPEAGPSQEGDETFAEQYSRSSVHGALQAASAMGMLLIACAREIVRPPFNWLPAAVDEAGVVFRRTIFPLAVTSMTYVLVYAVIMFGEFMVSLGVSDRYGAAATTGILREVSTWLTMMIFAGVAGSSITADIGARKVREELDALDVLGVGTVRYLVLPRVVGMTFAAVVLPLICFVCSTVLLDVMVVPGRFGYKYPVLWDGLAHSVTGIDFYAGFVKHFIMGLFVALVACERGLTCRRGAEGVGLAVKQTVVITFVGIWLMNSFYNTAYLSFFPGATALRG